MIVSLFLGIWAGVTIISHYNPFVGLTETLSEFIVKKTLADPANMGIIFFSFCIGGMIGVISRIGGAKSMMSAIFVLVLAFSLKSVITEMGLAAWLVQVTQGVLCGKILPLLIFTLAMVIAFATGTSWGTDSILMPIVIPISASVSNADTAVTPLMLASIGAVLIGAVFGDHCSPISDTTILSSMGSGSDHIDHVKTQFPYALTAAGFTIVFGFIPAGFGFPAWLCIILGMIGMIIFVKKVGKRVE
ncbi:MAG: Na+/H+ antiporter NhaC family protein [bacterium]